MDARVIAIAGFNRLMRHSNAADLCGIRVGKKAGSSQINSTAFIHVTVVNDKIREVGHRMF